MTATNSQRGTILRDTQLGEGLVSLSGRQFPFSLESHWKSDQPPVVGAKVDAHLDDTSGQLLSLRLVNEAELARELAGQAGQQLQQQASLWAARSKTAMGRTALAALGAVAIGWLILDQVSIKLIGTHIVSISMWQMLQIMNAPTDILSAMQSNRTGAGFWGWLMVMALLAPLAPVVWHDRRAQLGLCAPLAFIVVQAIRFYTGVHSAVNSIQEQAGSFMGQAAHNMSQQVLQMLSESTSFSAGFYIGLAGALTLASLGTLRFLARRT